ncbi:MAG: hypothetical protein HFI81_10930 [Eubacterium sp.]|jgi:stage III sporulation protein AE|nr:hypothetical protein [Eubacterium sp.]
MKRAAVWISLFLYLIFTSMPVCASSPEELMEELDFSELGSFLEKNNGTDLSFEEVVKALFTGGELPYETIGEYIKSLALSGFAEQKQLVLKILALCLAFSILKTYTKNFSNSYVSEICFFLCYCFLMGMLFESFSVMNETVLQTVETMTGFMRVLVPVFCSAMSYSLNFQSSAVAYSLVFTAIYLVEWMIRYLLAPLAQIYVIMEFLNYLMEEERFKRISELTSGAVRILLKAAITFILGINMIQGMVAPALDRLTGNSIAKTIQMAPVIGNVANGMGQIFLSSGIVIKNCIGAAALVVLIVICAVPFLKMALFAMIYKFLAAVLEPVADKRLSGGMNGIANGGMLYLKILNACLMLFFLTIALITAATGLGMGG